MEALKTLPTLLTLPAFPTHYRHRILGIIIAVVGIMGFASPYLSLPQQNSYTLSAVFQSAEGIGENTVVTLAGIPIGDVTHIRLNDDYSATVTMSLDRNILLPQDSSVAIVGQGMFGDRSLRITPGGFPINLQAGDQFIYTAEPVDFAALLQTLITQAERRQ